jgi:dihydrofolate reductase
MRKLGVFNHITVDGYIADKSGNMSFAHHADDPEWQEFVSGNAAGGGAHFVFGRVTYDMMASFWPTQAAMESMPVVAKAMNQAPKIVFSRSMKMAAWENTRVLTGDIAAAVRALKAEEGRDMLIFGSGSICAQLAEAGLIDEYRLIVNPIVLGTGKAMFAGPVALRRTDVRAFKNGNVLLTYVPA